ncbi:hypothetical protein BDN71DRAFT_1249097 [Pleurotus eryngii]|uniref:Uncharacterized protein n=1 Tax=Pleurotus eryngii TaxID=5323 RepID=A0A9P6DDH9_PLEER|nr:hypothetical protein BDN71DRAFT_1249097 [Pleurotus eryngii]
MAIQGGGGGGGNESSDDEAPVLNPPELYVRPCVACARFCGIRDRGVGLRRQGNELELTSHRRLRFECAARMGEHPTGRGQSEGFERRGWLVRRARQGLRLREGPDDRRGQRLSLRPYEVAGLPCHLVSVCAISDTVEADFRAYNDLKTPLEGPSRCRWRRARSLAKEDAGSAS